MMEAILIVVGAAVGGVIAWILATGRTRSALGQELSELKSRADVAESAREELRERLGQREAEFGTLRETLDAERQSRVAAETRQAETVKQLEEQKRLLAEAEKRLKESFEALAAKALQANAEQFHSSAKKTMETILAQAQGDLGKRQEAIGGLVKPIAESLKRYEEHLREIEQSRNKTYGELSKQVTSLAETNKQLQQETGRLATSLRNPKVRGRWGEIALRRAAELAGMSEHCDFEEQAHMTDEGEARYRPDMIVHLPRGRTIAVDAKAVLDAYLNAVSAADEEERNRQLENHAAQVRSRIRELSSKSYWDKLPATPEFVVLFLPGESFFSAAVEADHKLIETAIESRVILASPTTLIALLRAVEYGWQQEQATEHAERIQQLGRDLYDRIRTVIEHLGRMGTGLNRAVDSYNKAVGSLEGRVLPAARRFKELGAGSGADIPLLEPVEKLPREPNASRLDNETA